MSNVQQLPEKYLTLLPPSISSTLVSLRAKVENYRSQSSDHTSNSFSTSGFLDTKILFLNAQTEYFELYQLAVRNFQREHIMSGVQCQEERDKIAEEEYETANEAIAIRLGRKIIQEDIDDALKAECPIEDAYAASMVGRVRLSTGKQKAQNFSQSRFKQDVLDYYDARFSDDTSKLSWCHLLGWYAADAVRAAHLVPKSLEEDSVSYLFGGEVKPATDVRNALCLQRSIEKRLDCGDIAIVPVIGKEDTWKCLVTRTEVLDQAIDSPRLRFKHIHGKPLQFRSSNRPAKRYLFFRYIITYLQHRSEGNLAWAQPMETDMVRWTTPGKYLRKSTLRVLSRKVLGEDLPRSMLEGFDGVTFPNEAEPSWSPKQNPYADRAILDLKKCMQFTYRRGDRGDKEEEGEVEDREGEADSDNERTG